jgi:hypothetical protein
MIFVLPVEEKPEAKHDPKVEEFDKTRNQVPKGGDCILTDSPLGQLGLSFQNYLGRGPVVFVPAGITSRLLLP